MDFEAVGTIYFDLAKCASPHCFAALLRDYDKSAVLFNYAAVNIAGIE